MISRVLLYVAIVFTGQVTAGEAKQSIDMVFSADHKTQTVLNIESALARAQASLGIIPEWAAAELSKKAELQYVPQEELAIEYEKVRHRMVALLNVWQRRLDNGAEQYMHFGATTVDVYDTALVLQLSEATLLIIDDLRALELKMIALAEQHLDTLMIGRTLGQHALPITFGKKVASWLGENRRHIERMLDVYDDLQRSAILKGAVGSYLGLGHQAIQLEQQFARELGLSASPYIDDWHGSRDVFADYATTLALISKTYGKIGNELFLLQMTDIGETQEVRKASVVGSSTMPHKHNPSKSEALIFNARVIPRMAEVIVDDMINTFERDNTSRTNQYLADLSIQSEKMLSDAFKLISNLKVNEQTMRANIDRTQGLIMSQRLAFALAPQLGKTNADKFVHQLATSALKTKQTLSATFKQSQHASLLSEQQLSDIFDASTYLGLARQQAKAVIDYCYQQRDKEQRRLPMLN
ncbi:lyase family protein [Thalassotalea ponticola]|uniref:lyase family protein n=1 Tax=Thalassotalea ponticola TaxID=1523392 RepID=UPI0025B549B0|nr:lyase family protein [Thalassotalea ponticola]MDN3653924.1 lyase family protein [Thalassotalea ponticola]